MNSPKLLDAIAELKAQRRIIDDAIVHLERAVSALSGTPPSPQTAHTTFGGTSSYVDEAVLAIQAEGGALHVNKIVDFIAQLRGSKPPRASVESSIIRHISKTKNPKLSKVAPSTFDLTEHSQRELPIAS
jgi:hypothetical protein